MCIVTSLVCQYVLFARAITQTISWQEVAQHCKCFVCIAGLPQANLSLQMIPQSIPFNVTQEPFLDSTSHSSMLIVPGCSTWLNSHMPQECNQSCDKTFIHAALLNHIYITCAEDNTFLLHSTSSCTLATSSCTLPAPVPYQLLYPTSSCTLPAPAP